MIPCTYYAHVYTSVYVFIYLPSMLIFPVEPQQDHRHHSVLQGTRCPPPAKKELQDTTRILSLDDVKRFSDFSPCHTLRCRTPAMVRSICAAMPENRMRCAAIESSTCLIFWCRFWNISAIYCPISKRLSAF